MQISEHGGDVLRSSALVCKRRTRGWPARGIGRRCWLRGRSGSLPRSRGPTRPTHASARRGHPWRNAAHMRGSGSIRKSTRYSLGKEVPALVESVPRAKTLQIRARRSHRLGFAQLGSCRARLLRAFRLPQRRSTPHVTPPERRTRRPAAFAARDRRAPATRSGRRSPPARAAHPSFRRHARGGSARCWRAPRPAAR